MKLHKDGTLEGTPQEIAEYMALKDPKFGKLVMPLDSYTRPFTEEEVKEMKKALGPITTARTMDHKVPGNGERP